jgi:GGDEF domain-containing protein
MPENDSLPHSILGKALSSPNAEGGFDKFTQSADKIHNLIHLDQLTGLLNKSAFKERLSEAISSPEADQQIGVIFIDLKDFKKVNDEQGHQKGDQIIINVAEMLKETLRTTEDPEKPKRNLDIISNEPYYSSDESSNGAGRLGGDEFAIMLNLAPSDSNQDTELLPQEKINIVINRIREMFHNNEEVIESGIDISIGGAIYQNGQTPEELLQQADDAMYKNKEEQKRQFGSHR